ncbi:rhomboid family intramembrane serine protease [Brachybacterium aquaticum]|uniref:Membrane associated rhomboid family serine protease n=1 Tax=Brachybacterium aquaticum TaxID=1432564 RepID=A0A841AC50_9MICO|nr:rhomboid family intramembrane serine protease [Brachybacterium aquaticum]MBB5832809.1 membrane associated rhomboid family serine protease [Brachybacterium aquaticum]
MDRPTYGYSADDAPPPQGPPQGQPPGQPVCPRHPDRVSYVRCKRCDRPACPECQRPTDVGVLCVDCERDIARQQASARPRTAMGGRMGKRTPVVTYTLIALCVLAYLGQMVAPQIVEQLGIFAPFRALAMPWTFLSAGFLHGGIMHLALNMYALWAVGQYLEQTLGHVRYAAVYLVSVLGGHTAVYLLADPMGQSWVTGTVGASGGVFGLFAAMFIVNRRLGGQTAQILVLIALNLVITFTFPNISWQGHLGGLVFGALVTAGMFALRPKATPGADREALARRSALLHTGVVVAAVLLCVVLIAVKTVMVLGG